MGVARATVCIALTLAVATAMLLPAAGEGKSKLRRTCQTTSLLHSPGGAQIGRVPSGSRVIVVDYTRRKAWAYVLSKSGNGWVATRVFCSR